jgi:type I restriction enzyme M protein
MLSQCGLTAKPSLLVETIKIIEEIFVEIEKDVMADHAFQDSLSDGVRNVLLGAIASAGKTDSLNRATL